MSKLKLLQPLDSRYDHLKRLAASIGSKPSHYTLKHEVLYFMGKVWVPEGQARQDVIVAHHDNMLAGHPGKNKTVELI